MLVRSRPKRSARSCTTVSGSVMASRIRARRATRCSVRPSCTHSSKSAVSSWDSWMSRGGRLLIQENYSSSATMSTDFEDTPLELSDVRDRGRAGRVTMAAVLARAMGPNWSASRWRPRPERALSDACTPARAGAVGRAPPVQAVRACWQTPERNWPSLDPHRPLLGERTWNELPNLQRTPPSRCRCRSRSWVRHFSRGA
jgi:hypothetical protein